MLMTAIILSSIVALCMGLALFIESRLTPQQRVNRTRAPGDIYIVAGRRHMVPHVVCPNAKCGCGGLTPCCKCPPRPTTGASALKSVLCNCECHK